jgi:hypothetical protein
MLSTKHVHKSGGGHGDTPAASGRTTRCLVLAQQAVVDCLFERHGRSNPIKSRTWIRKRILSHIVIHKKCEQPNIAWMDGPKGK